jgi:hypothetical protein
MNIINFLTSGIAHSYCSPHPCGTDPPNCLWLIVTTHNYYDLAVSDIIIIITTEKQTVW